MKNFLLRFWKLWNFKLNSFNIWRNISKYINYKPRFSSVFNWINFTIATFSTISSWKLFTKLTRCLSCLCLRLSACLTVWCGIQQCFCSCFIYLIISEWDLPALPSPFHSHSQREAPFCHWDAFSLTLCNLLYCYIFAAVVLARVFTPLQTSDCLTEIAEISFRAKDIIVWNHRQALNYLLKCLSKDFFQCSHKHTYMCVRALKSHKNKNTQLKQFLSSSARPEFPFMTHWFYDF